MTKNTINNVIIVAVTIKTNTFMIKKVTFRIKTVKLQTCWYDIFVDKRYKNSRKGVKNEKFNRKD